MELILLQPGADDAQPAGVIGGAAADLVLLGHEVVVQPLAAVGSGHDALGAEDGAVLAAVQRRQDTLQLVLGKGLHRLGAPADEHLVGVVMVMVAAARRIVALLAVVVVMVVLMLVLVVVVVMVAAVVVVIIIVVVMVMVMAAVLMLVLVIMVMVMMLLLVRLMLGAHLRQQLVRQRHLLDGAENGHAVQRVPRGGQDGRGGVLLPQQRHRGLQLLLAQPGYG